MSWTFTGGGQNMPNLAYANLIPTWLLKQGFVQMVRMWDSKWAPALQKIMRRVRSPEGKSNFAWPLVVDPQMVSEMHGAYGRTKYITTGIDGEQWWTRMTKIGFMMEPEEFLNEFTPQANFGTNVKMQKLTQICIRAIERRIELELVNYLWGNPYAIENFSNQLTNRLEKFDLTSATKGMTGKAWNDYTYSNPFMDIDNAVELQEGMGDLPMDNMFVGSKTAKILKNHKIILERLKYVRDMSGGTLQAFYGGLDNQMMVSKVISNTAKKNAADANKPGTPFPGDMAADEWNNRNKYWFMRESNYEFVILASSNLGFVFSSKCNQFHENYDTPYTYSWIDHEPHIVRTRFELKFSPGVNDFANEMILRKACPITA
ncbi:MAG: hypothetical protein BV459_01965 [Thermoplasmata archaeon M11B2D]|nr:MAG: hypothetical protein BV459_01965 [Thermoplasmata archaeon M11B2D]